MAESILVTGKKISSMELVTNVTGNEKIPTGQSDDLALTPNQIADHTIARGDLANQEDLSQVEVSLGTQITDLESNVNASNNSIRGLIAAEEAARIAADNLKVDKEGSVSSVAGRVGDVVLAPSDVLVEGFGSQEDVNKYVAKPFLSGYTYGLGEHVILDSGVVVKSTVDGNVGNPNVDTTGWVSAISDSLSSMIQTFTTPEAGVDPVTGVAAGSYFDVRSSSTESYADEYQNVGGSAVATGKRYLSALGVQQQEKPASTIKDASGKTQQEVNNKITSTKSVSLWATDLVDALGKFDAVDFDGDETISSAVSVSSGETIVSRGNELNQTTPSTSTIETDYGAEAVSVSGLKLKQDKSAPISGGTSNNHFMFKGHGGRFNAIYQSMLDGQYGVSFGYGAIGPADRSTIGNLVAFCMGIDIQGMFIENLGAKYTRILGNILDSNTRGVFHGIRLSGYDKVGNPSESTHAPCWGVVGSGNVIRNITNGISAQNSSKFANLSALHFNNVQRCYHSTNGTSENNHPSLHRFDFTANEVEDTIIYNGLTNHTKFGFSADCSSLSSRAVEELSGLATTGFNHYEGILKDCAFTGAQFRYSHNLYNLQVDGSSASGVVVSGQYGGGTIIANACTTGVSIFGNYNNLSVVATNCTTNGFACGGTGNVIQLQTDGNVTINGNNNLITGRIGGNLIVTGSDNKFTGEVVGTVTRTTTAGNSFTDLRGWSGTVYQATALTTDSAGRVTVVVPKHQSAQIRNVYATIPTNTSEWLLKVISISGGSVMFELQDGTGTSVPNTDVLFNYEYSCS